jgi:hypothetical protein
MIKMLIGINSKDRYISYSDNELERLSYSIIDFLLNDDLSCTISISEEDIGPGSLFMTMYADNGEISIDMTVISPNLHKKSLINENLPELILDIGDAWSSVGGVIRDIKRILDYNKDILGFEYANKLYTVVSNILHTLTGCSAFKLLEIVDDKEFGSMINELDNDIEFSILTNDNKALTIFFDRYQFVCYEKYYKEYLRLFWKAIYCSSNRNSES